jgi:ElaB/YqjD/DUF883 family membrane-anchored ribosome-binding protein
MVRNSTPSLEIESASQAMEMAKEGLSQARDTAVKAYEQGRDKIETYGEWVQGCIRQQPLTSVLVATVGGLLIGLILAQTRSRT